MGILLASAVFLASASAAIAQSIDLSGVHPIMVGDDPNWADPDYDDADWPRQPVPTLKPWIEKGGALGAPVMWTRIRFRIDEIDANRDLAFHSGVFRGADRVFLNGIEIGGTANLSDAELTEDTSASMAWPRLYAIPPGLLRPNDENLLAIRMARLLLADAGPIEGPLEIAPFIQAASAAEARAKPFLINAALMLTIDVATVFGLIAALALAWRDRAIQWLGITVFVCYAPTAILLSLPARMIELVANPWFEFYLVKLLGLAVAPLAEFFAAMWRRRPGPVVRSLQVIHIILFLTPPWSGLGEDVLLVTFHVWTVATLSLFAILAWWGAVALRTDGAVAWPLLIGVTAVLATLAAARFISENDVVVILGDTPVGWALRVFMVSLGVMAAMRYFEMQRRLEDARASVLTAHESERRRLARDVHDSVGQWLSTIKLNVMMLRREHRDDNVDAGLGEMAGYVDQAISDARRIAHDLSPVLIEREGLAAAMRSHGDLIAAKGGPAIEVDAVDPPGLSVIEQGQLYRIFQEAVQNADRHGHAKHIRARVEAAGDVVAFSVDDDGMGFDSRAVDEAGIGLASIRERAELLGAECRIESAPGAGCLVSLVLRTKKIK